MGSGRGRRGAPATASTIADDRARRARRRRRRRARDRVAGAARARLGRGARARMRNRVLVDGRNMLDPDAMRAPGFVYEGIGRPVGMSLPAVILVGGQGTRLRPLTDRTRKDMLPLVDRPLLAYTFEHLAPPRRRRGRSSRAATCRRRSRSTSATAYGDLALEYAVEDEPLGTGGAIGFAAEGHRRAVLRAERRLAARGRPRRARRASTARPGRKATILLTPVADPSRYGLVRVHGGRSCLSFLEKPRPEEIDTEPHQRRPVRARARGARSRPAGPRRLDRARGLPAARRGRQRVYGIALAGLLARRRDARVVSPGAPRRARADLPDRGRRRARRRLHARRPEPRRSSRRAARAARLRRRRAPCRGGRAAREPRRARRGRATRQRAASSRTPVVGARAIVGARTHVVGSIVGDDAELGAGCELRNLAVVGPGAEVGDGNVLDHGLRIGGGRRRSPTRRCASRERRLPNLDSLDRWASTAQGREAVGLGARLGATDELRRQAPVRPGRRVAEPPVPRRKDESWLVQEGARELELGEVGRRARDDRDRARRRVPLPAAARCTASPRSRTRSSSRSRRRTSTTSCGSRTATAARARQRPERQPSHDSGKVAPMQPSMTIGEASRRIGLVAADAPLPRARRARRPGAQRRRATGATASAS